MTTNHPVNHKPIEMDLCQIMTVPLFVYNDKQIIEANRAAELLSGYPCDELQTMRLEDLIDPDDQIEAGAISGRQEFRWLTKAGLTCWVDFTSHPAVYKNEPVFIGTAIDISAYKQMAQNLQLSNEILKQLPDAIIITDPQGKIQQWLGQAKEVFGYHSDEAVGQHVSLLHHPDIKKVMTDEIIRDVQRTGRFFGEIPCVRKDGVQIPIETQAQTIYTNSGEAWARIGINRDISERKKSEAALRQAYDELEKRTEALEQQTIALAEAKEAAEVANQAKSEFLSNMSHELRTPLNGILGYAQILRRESHLLEGQKNGLNIIYQSGQHLLTLINDILDLSKIEARTLELVSMPVHLPTFLANLTDLMQMQAWEKGLRFEYETDGQLPTNIMADEKRLRQVLLNLVGNAVKFTEQGRVTLMVASTPTPQSSRCKVRFEVTDTGAGIALSDQMKIFQPFEQVGDIHQRAKGTGLGLAISQQLVTAMGGQLQVHSILGQGSTFWFEATFPIIDSIEDTQNSSSQIIGYKGKRRLALVVDDNIENCLVLRDMLEPIGFEVVLAENGQQGIMKAQALEPDIILMDLVMPVMTGFEAIQIIRQNPLTKDQVIIAISANAFEKDQQQSEKLGYQAFISKPVDEQALLAELGQHLALEWTYRDTDPNASNIGTAFDERPDEALVPPTAHELETLYEMAVLGSLPRIKERADQLEKEDVRLAPFANQLRELVRGFEDKKLLTFIEQYLETR